MNTDVRTVEELAAALRDAEEELHRSQKQTQEALERQTATAEILKVIASSPSDVQPVFDAIADTTMKLFGAWSVVVTRYDGEFLHYGAARGALLNTEDIVRRRYPARLGSELIAGRSILKRSAMQFRDCQSDPDPKFRETACLRGFRAALSVPMFRGGEPIGSINVTRDNAGVFPGTEVELLKAFADQAVIAIENVRLFNETKEALERQTATAEILKVIAGSPTDVQPVFDSIAEAALRLFGGYASAVTRVVGDMVHLAAITATNEAGNKAAKSLYPRPLSYAGIHSAVARSGKPAYLSDIENDPEVPPESKELARAQGFRSQLVVPMLREGIAIGTISVARSEAGLFTDHQIKLLETFADQAVIAIENVRLFKELESRTAALSKSVGQLTALGEVGQAISSTLDLDTVLKTIVSRANQLTGLDGGAIYEYDPDRQEFRLQISENMADEIVQIARKEPIRLGNGAIGQTGVTREATQVPDTLDDSYDSDRKEVLIRAGYRAVLAVPLLREDDLLGALLVTRKTSGPFAPEIVDLLKTFASQSALAIQNARLFREIEDKSRQLEVASRHKSEFLANMSHELRTPLNAVIGFSEVLGERMFGELTDKQDEYVKDIHSSGKHLLSLINDILDLSKIEAGKMELELSDFDLPAALQNAITLLKERAQRHSINLTLAVDQGLDTIVADERKFKQIMLNLLSNAVKFTPDGGSVTTAASSAGPMVEISVSDSGIGISVEDQNALFEEFKQVGPDRSRNAEGTGLGLALTKRIIELHGGTIRVASTPGKGSTFTFTIPSQP